MEGFPTVQSFLIQQLKGMELTIDSAKIIFFGLETETAHRMVLDWLMENYDTIKAKTIAEREKMMIQKAGELIKMGVTTKNGSLN